MLKTIEFIKENNKDWKELLSQAPYSLIIKEDDSYYLLKYNQLESDMSNEIVKECRGLIIDKQTLTPKALSFLKFFNIEEPNADRISWSKCRVQEKVDGSKILVWFDKNKWNISTSGNLDAFKTNVGDLGFTYGDLFEEGVKNAGLDLNKFFNLLNPKYCYTFELISPKSRIVIAYKKTEIRFIGLRDVDSFDEVDPDIESSICQIIKRPKEFPIHSMSECIDRANKLGLTQEGFVVVDYKWRRVKVKSPLYIQAHYLKNNSVQSQSRLLDIIESNEKDEFLSYFPEWTDKIKEIEEKYNNFKNNVIKDIKELSTELKTILEGCSVKELAIHIQNKYPNNQAFLYKYFKIDLPKYFVDNEYKQLTKDKKLKYLGLKEEKEVDTLVIEDE